MPQRDGLNNVQIVHLGNLALSGTTPAASAWVDTKGFDSVIIQIVANTVTDAGTASGFTLTAQEGADTTTVGASAVAALEMANGTQTITVTSDSADNTAAGGLGYLGNDRYFRVNGVGTTNTDADVSVIALCTRASIAPPDLIGTSVAAT